MGNDSRLTHPGMWVGFISGVLIILGNPKAILFYMGVLPGFFDLTKVVPMDIIAIVVVSISIPLLGNLTLAIFVNKARAFLQPPRTVRRLNTVSGMLLIAVRLVIPFV